MSQRFEHGYIALVIFCLVGLAIIAVVSWTVPYSKGYQAADKDHEAAYAAHDRAEEYAIKCAAEQTPSKAIKCYQEAEDRNREQQRAEQDLDAQREMANWAEGMLWATIFVGSITIGITALGVYWVRRTLEETRRATNAAFEAVEVTRDIGRKQVRAYPSVTSVQVGGITNGLPSFIISVRNSGNSPALKMNSRGRLMLAYQENTSTDRTVAQCGMEISVISEYQVPISPNSEGKVKVYVPHSDDPERENTMKEMASVLPRKNPYWSVNVLFDWVDVFGTEYGFYINARQLPNSRRRKVAGKEGAMDELVLRDPFEISFQSESRQREKD